MKIEIKKGKKCIIVKVDEGKGITCAQYQDGFHTEAQAFKAFLDHMIFYYKPEGSDYRVDIMPDDYLKKEQAKDSYCKHCYQDLPLDRVKPHEWELFDNPKDKKPVELHLPDDSKTEEEKDENFMMVKDVDD